MTQGNAPSRVLVVRLSALGDIVHALPVVTALRRAYPAVTVDWLVEEHYAAILDLVPSIDERIVVRARASGVAPGVRTFGGATGYLSAVRHLRSRRYDLALDLQGLIKSAAWARLAGASRVVGFDPTHLREPHAARFYTETVVPPSPAHVMRKNLAVAAAVGGIVEPVELPIVARGSAGIATAIAGMGGKGGYAVINPGAAWPNKRWPPARFGTLAAGIAKAHGVRSFVTWGPGERPLADEIARASGGAATAAPPTPIEDLAVLLRDAAVVVSGDTGPMHIAAAMGAPIVGLFGPTWPERNGPWDPQDEVVSRADACGCHHKRYCVRGAPCIETIEVGEVGAAVDRRLAGVRASRGGR